MKEPDTAWLQEKSKRQSYEIKRLQIALMEKRKR